ncbi:MAG: ribonuclease P protein component [Spirosomaceae bacterium]|jgi:ribonuclease P protein component|nr:ribonuclease P protein component [Spirosomataceae bacterium]
MKQTFPKNERLCSKKIIDRLFEKGRTDVQTAYLFPFKVFYLFEESLTHALPQVLFSISKRNFKKAVQRNLLRRRCREAYRKNKFSLTQNPDNQPPAYVAFVLIAKEEVTYAKIEKSMRQLLSTLSKPPQIQ